METDDRLPIADDRFGPDLDLWGREAARPVLMPRTAGDCVAAEEGQCPPGCRECEKFAEQMDMFPTVGATHASPGGCGE